MAVSGMKKTVLTYGVFGLLMALQIGIFYSLGSKPDPAVLLSVLAFDAVVLLIFIRIDFVGAIGFIAALLPFSKAVGDFELGFITLNPYVLGILFLAVLASRRIIFSFFSGRSSRADKLLVAVALTYLFSTMFSADVLGSGYLAFHALFIPILSYFAFQHLINKEEDWRKVTSILLTGIAVFGLFTISKFLVSETRVTVLGIPWIGAATLLIIPLVSIVALGKWKQWFWLGILVVAICAFIATFSRMYMLMLLGAPFIYGIIRKGHAHKLIALFFIGSLLLTIVLASMPAGLEPDNYSRDDEYGIERVTNIDAWKWALSGRAYSYQEGLSNFLDKPLFGSGLYKGEGMITRHNFNVEWLEYSGLLGYFLYTGFFYTYFKRASAFAKADKYVAANLTIILMVMGNSATNGFMHGMMPLVTMLLLGLTAARIRILWVQSIQIGQRRANA